MSAPLNCRICEALLKCTTDEIERFRSNLGVAIAGNATLVDEQMFCAACFAEMKQEAREKEQDDEAKKKIDRMPDYGYQSNDNYPVATPV